VASRKIVEEFIIPKSSSRAFILKKEQILRVTAHEGKQVADIRFLNANNYKEQFASWLSASLNSNEGIGGTKRVKKLYSKSPWHNVMLTVINDTSREHLMACQCTPKLYEILGDPGHISCADLFDKCLKPYNLSMEDLDSAGVFNVYMSVKFLDDENGTWLYQPPGCEKGDHIDFLAEMEVLVAATSCPADSFAVNDYECKGMKYQIIE